MTIQQTRLLSLIEFVKSCANLRVKPAADVATHRLFYRFEQDVQGLPGLQFNTAHSETDDEIWLTVPRMRKSPPPPALGELLSVWMTPLENRCDREPQLRKSVPASELIAAGLPTATAKWNAPALNPRTANANAAPLKGAPVSSVSSAVPAASDSSTASDSTVSLDGYARAAEVRAQFTAYLETVWRSWADQERRKREVIALYASLFTLKQQLEGSIVEAQIELVWGVGIGVWNADGVSVRYPLMTRLIELALDPETSEITVRPRDVDPRFETAWYASVDNPGVAEFEREAREFLAGDAATFSPFDPSTYEPLLRVGATYLDANGVYWPDQVGPDDRTVPKPDSSLKVTGSWVIFARPRTNSAFLQDLTRFSARIEEAEQLPPAVAAIVTDPSAENPIVELPPFRGLSTSGPQGEPGAARPRDLFFPMPYNEEQVQIVQLLESADGVVVQGPPGTGKTHTIANVICHYLAEGKRVLVTSMKDPALAVLRDKLPEEIQPLAISLLTSEREGMKQFEHAIHRIASEVQSLDRAATVREIGQLEGALDALHDRIGALDRQIDSWAERNLEPISLEGETIYPHDAARDVIDHQESFAWIPDPLGIGPEFVPQFDDADIVELRDARRTLGADIEYLDASLPPLADFPDARELLTVHQDLARLEKMQRSVENGEVPALADAGPETLSLATELAAKVESYASLRDELASAGRNWTGEMLNRLRDGRDPEMLRVLEGLGSELEKAASARRKFVERPVELPANAEIDSVFMEALSNLVAGKSAFGLKALFVKAEHKARVEAVTVQGTRPGTPDAWAHVHSYANLALELRKLASRWNALREEFQLPPVANDGLNGGMEAAREYAFCRKARDLVAAEQALQDLCRRVFPEWPYSQELHRSPQRLAELEAALRHHTTRGRLSNVWATRQRFQQVLDSRTGPVVEQIRAFLGTTLGSPEVEDAAMQSGWSALTSELGRVLALQAQFATVAAVCERIRTSGAPALAHLLTRAPQGEQRLPPDDWRSGWRRRRLATHLESIDPQGELRRLATDRHQAEEELARTYQSLVSKRTWLKLAENASHEVRAALQAYLNAIKRIGKGTGKRAVRYRQDARVAAEQANRAVPCWIMPHYRISESLPAELGSFDLLVIDEASQSDLTALPALLRAAKALMVGDDKQVSPEGIGLEEEKVRSLMNRFLKDQVTTYRPQMSPDRSIYDLFKVVFAQNAVMLKEHFRCAPPIIEYSKREFYSHELRPLRIQKPSERIDPPLVDVLVQDGSRDGDLNRAEIQWILNEIRAITENPNMQERSIGVVSLLGDKQTEQIWQRLFQDLGPEVIQRHDIACGDARTFQGKERDIMFLTMVVAPNEKIAPLSRDTFAQRFNVAASRARDRMYLVRSVEAMHLSDADRLRRSLLDHFTAPFAQSEGRVEDLRARCESPFERELYDALTERGYRVTPQVRVGQYRIDLVVEGDNDARLAVECDGDRYHGADRWPADMQRQRILERTGWVFWRCFASNFIRKRQAMLDDLLATLSSRGIRPADDAAGSVTTVHVEKRVVTGLE